MAEDQGKVRSERTPIESDETLRLYLLCRLEENERLRIDERLLDDNELAERITLVESELTDDYAAGRLDTSDHEAFAKTFLVTDDRQRQLRFTSVLQDYSRSQAMATASVTTARAERSWRERLAALFNPGRPLLAFASSFAVLLLLVGLVWFIAKQRRDSKSLTAKHDAPTPTLSPASPAGTVPHGPDSPGKEPTPAKKPEAVVSPSEAPPTIVSFVLLPGAGRSGGELARIAVPAGKRDVVRLSLVIEEATAAGLYEAEVATAEGQAVVSLHKLKAAAGNRVVLELPGHLLHGGDYQIKLTKTNATGQTETVGRYYFRASKS